MLKRLGKPKNTDADFASKSLYAGELYLSLFCASEIYFLSKILSALNLKSRVFDLKTLSLYPQCKSKSEYDGITQLSVPPNSPYKESGSKSE